MARQKKTDEETPDELDSLVAALVAATGEVLTAADIREVKRTETSTIVLLHDCRKFVLADVTLSVGGAADVVAFAGGELVAAAGDGRTSVVVMSVGVANAYVFSSAVLREAAPLFSSRNVYLGHADARDRGPNGERKPHDLAGVLGDIDFTNGHITGVVRWGGPAAAAGRSLAQFYLDAAGAGAVPDVGVSASLALVGHFDDASGCVMVDAISSVESVDVVCSPAFGTALFQEFLSKQESDVNVFFSRMEAADKGGAAGSNGGGAAVVQPVPAVAAAGRMDVLEKQFDQKLVNLSIDQAAGLTDEVRADLHEMFDGRAYDEVALAAAVERKRSLIAKLNEASTVQNFGAAPDAGRRSAVAVGLEGFDRLELAVDAMFGNETPVGASFERLRGARDLYHQLTGDYEMRGAVNQDNVRFANVTTATLPNVVKNAMNKRVAMFFSDVDVWWRDIIAEEDLLTLNAPTWITAQGIGPMPTVVEGAAYTDLTLTDTGETSAWLKRGGILPITLETFDRDDTGALKALPVSLARSAFRALSSSIAAMFTSSGGVGPTLTDTRALFNITDGNLITTALAANTWDSVIQTMFKQVLPGTTFRSGIRPKYLLVPIELEKTGLQVLGSEVEPQASTLYRNVRFGSSNVRTCPEFTDANDWVALADPKMSPSVVVGYRFGKMPEIISDGSSRLFESDVLGLKARFFYTVGTYGRTGAVKANVV